jgi:hypothetical protein
MARLCPRQCMSNHSSWVRGRLRPVLFGMTSGPRPRPSLYSEDEVWTTDPTKMDASLFFEVCPVCYCGSLVSVSPHSTPVPALLPVLMAILYIAYSLQQ